jgi:hypothetical protein
MKSEYHRRLPDFEAFDRIELEVVPRYKTSGLSGDCWRQIVVARFFFKGEQVHEAWFGSMRYAVMLLGSEWLRQQEPIPERVIELEESACDQPSCTNKAVSKYRLKRLFSRSGDLLDAADQHGTYYRKFCKVHLRRGDANREDNDKNYVVEGPGPDASTNVQESPAVFGGVIDMGDE